MTERPSIDLNGVATLSGKVYEPRVGVWWAEVVLDSEEAPEGAAILSINGDVQLSGTIEPKRTVVDNGRASVRLEGGSGNLDARVASKSFRKATVRDVVNALFFETGDALDETSGNATLTHQVPYWTWGETMGEAILHSIAHEAGASWRAIRSGQVWIGEETWPELDDGFEFVQGPIHPGQTIIWPEKLPLVRPGVTFQGSRVSEVLTTWGEDVESALQQTVVFEQTRRPTRYARSIQTSVVDWFDRTKGQELDLSKHYPAKVVGQSADLRTVDLRPDDLAVRGDGLQNVPLRFGAPGLTPRLRNGARCLLGWEAADPKRPYAALFEAEGILEFITLPDEGADISIRARGGGNVTLTADEGGVININGETIVNGGGLEVACKGDAVFLALPTATAPGAPCAPPIPGAPTMVGIIGTGRARFRSS